MLLCCARGRFRAVIQTYRHLSGIGHGVGVYLSGQLFGLPFLQLFTTNNITRKRIDRIARTFGIETFD